MAPGFGVIDFQQRVDILGVARVWRRMDVKLEHTAVRGLSAVEMYLDDFEYTVNYARIDVQHSFGRKRL